MELRELRRLRNKYLPGTLIMLIHMEDIQAPSFGTKGRVEFVDDIGQIHIKWENGSSLALIDGVDMFRVLEYGDENYDNGN